MTSLVKKTYSQSKSSHRQWVLLAEGPLQSLEEERKRERGQKVKAALCYSAARLLNFCFSVATGLCAGEAGGEHRPWETRDD